MDRRNFIGASATLVGASSVLGVPALIPADAQASTLVNRLPLSDFSPRSPINIAVHSRMVQELLRNDQLRELIRKFVREYKKTNDPKYLEWSLMYGFLQWRGTPNKAKKASIAQLFQKFAATLRQKHPEHPAGHVWGALYYGFEMVARGALNSLNLLPQFEKTLSEAEAKFSQYYYGFVHVLRGRALMKAPPFPVSIGNLTEAIKSLELGEPQLRGKIASWYISYAECMYLAKGQNRCFEILDLMVKETKPVDFGTYYVQRMAYADGDAMREAILNGTYDRYTYDSLSTPLSRVKWR